jgi:hypothetical protein
VGNRAATASQGQAQRSHYMRCGAARGRGGVIRAWFHAVSSPPVTDVAPPDDASPVRKQRRVGQCLGCVGCWELRVRGEGGGAGDELELMAWSSWRRLWPKLLRHTALVSGGIIMHGSRVGKGAGMGQRGREQSIPGRWWSRGVLPEGEEEAGRGRRQERPLERPLVKCLGGERTEGGYDRGV